MTHRKNKAFDFNIVFNYGIFVVIGVYRYQKLRKRLKVYYEEVDIMRQKRIEEQKERSKETKPIVK